MDTVKESKKPSNEPRWLVLNAGLLTIIAIACAIALLIIAFNLKIDYYDGAGYLSNTRILSGEDLSEAGLGYEFIRPLLLSFLTVPFALLFSSENQRFSTTTEWSRFPILQPLVQWTIHQKKYLY